MRSVIKEEGETAEIIHKMSKILRKSISWSRDWISVAEEMEAVKCFLEIQKYRFDEELDYSIQVEDEAIGLKVPNMIFLPFVENASIHGIESIPGKGVIRISIGLEQGRLVFRLSDNGIGMSPDKLEEIRRYLNRDDVIGERVGMKNAYYRLKLIYRDRFSFDIQSKEGEGTSIEIGLPLTEPQA
jgi:two-component system sensor histidine kinase YesM